MSLRITTAEQLIVLHQAHSLGLLRDQSTSLADFVRAEMLHRPERHARGKEIREFLIENAGKISIEPSDEQLHELSRSAGDMIRKKMQEHAELLRKIEEFKRAAKEARRREIF